MTDSGYYYSHSFTENERQSLKEFFGRDIFGGSYGSSELTDEQIDQISARIMPRVRSSIRVADLLSPLRRFKILTDTEYSHLRSGCLEREEQAVRLMEYLMNKGMYGLAVLYLSLLTSSESKGGLPAHYKLARELREIVLEYCVSGEDSGGRLGGLANGPESQTLPLSAAVKRLRGISLSPEAARALATHLGLPSHQAPPTDLSELCCQWLGSRSICDVTRLVEGMVVTEGIGRHTTRLCQTSSVPSRDLRNFLLTLGEEWREIARYIGFSEQEVSTITSSCPGNIGKQVDSFLEEWRMPDSGQKVLPLMHRLKTLAGIVEPKKKVRVQSRRPWRDESGAPPRRLDTYPHPHPPPRPASPPRSTHHHSHSSHTHVHSIRHHPGCPHQNGVHGRTEDYYDDYDNTGYSSFSGTVAFGGGGHVHLTFLMNGGGGSVEGRKNYHKQLHNSHHYTTTDDDPIIEELPSDQTHYQSRPAVTGNETTAPDPPPSRPLSSSSTPPKPTRQSSTDGGSPSGHRRVSRTEPHTLLGNEVEPSLSLDASRGRKTRGFERGSSSTPLGNEVLMEGYHSVDSGRSGGLGRGRSSFERGDLSGSLGNEVTPPGLNHLGNEVPVGVQGGRSSGGSGEGSANKGGSVGLLGNEVSMPMSARLGPSKQRFKDSLVSSPSVGLGNEVPMPGVARFGRRPVSVVENELTVQPLPGGTGRSRSSLVNEVESSDSGYTGGSEPAPVHPRRRSLKSDSSVDSSSGLSSRNSLIQQPAGPGTGSLTDSDAAVECTVPPNSRSPSPDNDLSSGEENESSIFSGPPAGQPVSSGANNLSPVVTNKSPLQDSTAGANPPSLHSAQPDLDPQSVTSAGRLAVVPQSAPVLSGEDGRMTAEDEDNDLDCEGEEEVTSKPEGSSSQPRDLTLSLPSPQLEASHLVESQERESSGGYKEVDLDNDLSAPSPETPNDHKLSAQVFMQISYNPLPDNDAALVVAADPTSSTVPFSDLSTEEQVEPAIAKLTHTHPPGEPQSTKEVEEYCSEDVLQAVQERNGLDMLTALVASGASVCLPGPNGAYPIHLAVAHRHHETVLFLLNQEECIKLRKSDGKTPLHVACVTGDFEMVQILVEKGADLAAQDTEGYTCMHLRETLQSLNLVRYLALHGAPVDTPSHESYLTPLMMCCHIGDEAFETAQFLISMGAKVDGCQQAGMKPLIIVCAEGFEVLVDLLLGANADINIQDHDGFTPLLRTCQSGSVSLARKLCERRSDSNPNGANVNLANNEGLTPMLAAVQRNERELVVLLITHGATVNCYKLHKLRVGGGDRMLEVSPLSCAAARGSVEMVKLLVQHEANVNATATAMAPIAVAAMCGQLAVVRHFINLNDLDLSLPAMAQPFMEAVTANQFECAEAIVTKKYRTLDEMCTAAQQSGRRELVDSINQLQKMQQLSTSQSVPTAQASSVPPSAPQTNTGNPAVQTAQRPSSTPSSAARVVTPLPLQAGPDRASPEYLNNLVGEEDDENNLNDEDDLLTPSAQGGSGGIVAALPLPPTAPDPTLNPDTTMAPPQVEENNLGNEGRLTARVPEAPGTRNPTADNGENNLDEEDTIPLEQGSSDSAAIATSVVSPPVSVVTPGPPSNIAIPENNLDDDGPLSPLPQGYSSSIAPAVPPSVLAPAANPSSASPRPPANNLDAVNDLDAGDHRTDIIHGARETWSNRVDQDVQRDGGGRGARGCAAGETENNLHQTSAPVAAATTADPIAAVNNLDVDHHNNENNLDDDEEVSAAAEEGTVHPQNTAAHATNLNVAPVVAASPASGVPRPQDIEAQNNDSMFENNLEEEEGEDGAAGGVEPLTAQSGGADAVENDLDEESLTNSAVSRARDGMETQSTGSSGQAAGSASAEAQNNLDNDPDSAASINNLGVDQPGRSSGNDLSVEQPRLVEENNLNVEVPNSFGAGTHTTAEMANNLDTGTAGGVQDGVSSAAEMNNLDGEDLEHNSQVGIGGNPAHTAHGMDATTAAVENSFDDLVSVSPSQSRPQDHRGRTTQEQRNNLDAVGAQNDLGADEGSTTAKTTHGVGHDEVTVNNFDEPESSVQPPSEQASQNSLPPNHLTSTSSLLLTGTTSLTASNAVHAPPVGNLTATSAPASMQAAGGSQSQASKQHNLTEENNFDDDVGSGDLDRELQGHLPTSAPEPRHVRWAESVEEDGGGFEPPPLPTSAPVGRSSGTPLRASVDTSSFPSRPPAPVAMPGGEDLFAPRPKSPPTRAPTPPPPSPYNMLSMANPAIGGMGPEGGGGGSFEVLHDFAQMCMMAAVKTKGQEWLINKATETGYDNLTEFFIKFFYDDRSMAEGGKLVSEFIGGDPSPLNFLLAGHFINHASFIDAASELGQPDFMNDFSVALHQFPGSDNLPYTGAEMAEALFNQTFCIGHRYPDPSALWSSPSFPPQNAPASSFPGQGHQLGRSSSQHDFSNFSQPAFHSVTTTTASGATAASSSTPGATSSLPTSSSQTQTSVASSGSASSLSDSDKDLGAGLGSSVHARPCPPPHSTLSVLQPSLPPSTSSLPPSSSSGSKTNQLPQTTGHYLTEENNFFGEESGALNDLTTDQDDHGAHWPRVPTAHDGHATSLGNEIDVKAVNHSLVDPKPSSPTSLPLIPPSASNNHTLSTLPNNFTPPTPSPAPLPHTSQTASQLTPLSPSPPLYATHRLPHSDPLSPFPSSTSSSKEGTVDQRPVSLTPSPDPVPPPKKPPTLVLKIKKPAVVAAPSTSESGNVSPQSSSGFLSPGSLSPTTQGAPPTTKPLKKAPRSDGAVVESSRTATKPYAATKTKGSTTSTKMPRGSSGTKTKTVASGSPSTTRSKLTASKPPALTTTKRTQLGTPANPKATTARSKISAARTKPPSSTASPRLGKKTPPSTPATSSKEPVPLSTRVKKSTQPKPTSRQPASKPPSTNKPPLARASNKVGKTTGTAGAATARTTPPPPPPQAETNPRSLARNKVGKGGSSAGTSSSSLTDEEPSAPFTALERTGEFEATPSWRYGSEVVGCGTSSSDVISFPDTVVCEPDTCPVFKALAHRIRKWKILGRYLGLSDQELDDIEESNQFTTDRCFNMLVTWAIKYRGRYSELEVGIHNIMREDLVEDVRPLLPVEQAEQYSEEQHGNVLKFSAFSVQEESKNFEKLAKSVTQFVRNKNHTKHNKFMLRFSHDKLHRPLEVYLPSPPTSTGDCDLRVLEELCFAARNRSVSSVDLVFEAQK